MSTGRVLAEALALVRRRRVLALGMLVAVLGLVYAALYVALTLYNPRALDEFSSNLSADLPPAFPLWLAAGALVLLAGGLVSEGGLILTAAGRAQPLPAPAPRRRSAGAIGRLPALLAVAVLVWWLPALLLALTLAPALAWLASGQDATQDWALALLGSGCCTTLLFGAVWLLFWPQQRLANCALLLDGELPRAAARTGRRLFWGQFGTVLGLWLPLLLLNLVLILVSALLAGLAAGLIFVLWTTVLAGIPDSVALPLAAVLAALAGLGLLLWDGAVSAFNLNAWVLAYRALRPVSLPPPPALGTTQILGRQRET